MSETQLITALSILKKEERKKKGKPAVGNFSLLAYHESGQVVIEISDDGKGIDHEKIKLSAIEKGVIDKSEADKLSDF